MKITGLTTTAKTTNFKEQINQKNKEQYKTTYTGIKGHTILEPTINKKNPILYVIVKNEFLKSFTTQFPNFTQKNPEMIGEGESINQEAIRRAIIRGCNKIIFIHPNNTYEIPLQLIIKYCTKHELIRTQKKINQYIINNYTGKTENKQETTYSFPKKLLEEIQ